MSAEPSFTALAEGTSRRCALAARYSQVRAHSLALAAHLSGGWSHPARRIDPDDPRAPAGHWQVRLAKDGAC